MPVVGVPAIFNDDIGVLFEDRDYLLIGEYTFSFDYAPLSLVVHLF